MYEWAKNPDTSDFEYYGVEPGEDFEENNFYAPLTEKETKLGLTKVEKTEDGKVQMTIGNLNAATAMPKRLAPGHGACPGCGIPVNINLL